MRRKNRAVDFENRDSSYLSDCYKPELIMLITTEWSVAKAVTYGSNIRVRSSRGGIYIKISCNDPLLEHSRFLPADAKELLFTAEEITELTAPFIQFKTQSGEAHVDYVLF